MLASSGPRTEVRLSSQDRRPQCCPKKGPAGRTAPLGACLALSDLPRGLQGPLRNCPLAPETKPLAGVCSRKLFLSSGRPQQGHHSTHPPLVPRPLRSPRAPPGPGLRHAFRSLGCAWPQRLVQAASSLSWGPRAVPVSSGPHRLCGPEEGDRGGGEGAWPPPARGEGGNGEVGGAGAQ